MIGQRPVVHHGSFTAPLGRVPGRTSIREAMRQALIGQHRFAHALGRADAQAAAEDHRLLVAIPC
jgi:hypothetical protein